MEVNIATRSLMIIVHTMGFLERRQFQEPTRKWGVRKDELENHGACKEYEIACRVFLTFLGRCCRYYHLLDKQRTFKLFGWWHSRGGMDM
jgi:hypothetical protein